MSKKLDLIGKRFGRLVVIQDPGIKQCNQRMMLCKCDCGNEKLVRVGHLQSGSVRSCGCYRLEVEKSTTWQLHGLSHTALYKVWTGIKDRCYNPTRPNYKTYGAKGIKMCDEWLHSPEVFIKWSIEHGYQKGLQIDRIDTNGDYSPENCRWVTPEENSNNKNNNHRIVINGEELTIAQAKRKYHISRDIYNAKIREKMLIADAIKEEK